MKSSRFWSKECPPKPLPLMYQLPPDPPAVSEPQNASRRVFSLVEFGIVRIAVDDRVAAGILVPGQDPRVARGLGLVTEFDDLLADVACPGLERRAVEVFDAHKRIVDLVDLGGIAVDDDEVVIGVDSLHPFRHVLALCVRVGVLLAEVPLDAVAVAEARGHLAHVDHALDAERGARDAGAAVEHLVVLGLLKQEIDVDAFGVHVVEQDLPLRQLRDVVGRDLVVREIAAGIDAVAGPRSDILAVAVDGVRQDVDRVLALFGQIVDRAEDRLALAAVPGLAVAVVVGQVVREIVPRDVAGRIGAWRRVGVIAEALPPSVEIRRGEKVLRNAGAATHEIVAVALMLEVMRALVLEQHALGAEIVARLVGRRDVEGPGRAVEIGRGAGVRVHARGDIVSGAERRLVGPFAFGWRVEVHPPDVAVLGVGVGRVAIGGEVTRHADRLSGGRVREGDVEPIVAKRVGFLPERLV